MYTAHIYNVCRGHPDRRYSQPEQPLKPKENKTFKILTLFTLHSSARSTCLYILVLSSLLVLLRILVLMNNHQLAVNFQHILLVFVKFFFTSYHSLIKRTPTLNPSPRMYFKCFSYLFLHSGLKIWPNSNLTKKACSGKKSYLEN